MVFDHHLISKRSLFSACGFHACRLCSMQELKSCGISDIDQIRLEVKSSPTTKDNYLSRARPLAAGGVFFGVKDLI